MLKEYKKLQNSSQYREKKRQIALEGPNLVRAALNAGFAPDVVFYTQDYFESGGEEWLKAMSPAVKQVILPPALFKSIAATESPQAVAAITPFGFEEKIQKWELRPEQLVLILDRLRDPGNLGTIIRTAAAAGVDIIYYTSGSADPFNPKVLRATAGAIFSVSVELTRNPLALIRNLKQKGLQVVATAAQSDLRYWSIDYKLPAALLIGNETDGLAEELGAEADCIVSIPVAEAVESLNAAVASAVIIYEIIRQRRA